MEKDMLFVYNPVSGRAQIRDSLAEIIETFTKSGYRVTVHPTAKRSDCFEYFSKHAGAFDVVSVCGGDGMLNETVSALMQFPPDKRPPIAYLPAGSTNDFAASVGLAADLKTCVKKITAGEPFLCDAGQFCDKYFSYIAAFGAFTSVAYDTSQELKNTFGHFAYVVEGIRSFAAIKATHMKITYENKTIEDNFIYGMITNTMQVGGILRTNGTNKVSLNDGLFEVLLVKEAKSALDFQAILSAIITQNLSSNLFVWFKASEIILESDLPIPWTLDGEYGGNVSSAKIANIPRAFSVIV